MSRAFWFKLALVALVLLIFIEIAECQADGGVKSPPKRPGRPPRRRMPGMPYDPLDDDLDDIYDDDEDRPPHPPGMRSSTATPKLVKGLNLKGERGKRHFQKMTDRLKQRGQNLEHDMDTSMKRAHKHEKVMEKLRRQRIAEARKARAGGQSGAAKP